MSYPPALGTHPCAQFTPSFTLARALCGNMSRRACALIHMLHAQKITSHAPCAATRAGEVCLNTMLDAKSAPSPPLHAPCAAS